MLKNSVKIALRRLSRERFYVLINIFSLGLGIASFLILALYLRSELTYDRQHVNHDRIYRIVARFDRAGAETKNFAQSQLGLAPLLVQDYPQLGTYVRFLPSPEMVLAYSDARRIWQHMYLTDPAVFKVFTHRILYGNVENAFDDPYSIAISESMSRFYFGDENPIGRQLSGPSSPLKVTLVFADLPENTHLKYDALLPISLLKQVNPDFEQNYMNTLWNVGNYTYLMVPSGFAPDTFGRLCASFYERRMKQLGERLHNSFRADLQLLTDQHFGEKLEGDQLTGNIFYVYGFAAVAIFILVIGCINYVNLATARAMKRAKEVGMRKVLGAGQPQLVAQFLGESLVFTAAALVFALAFIAIALALTPIGALMGKEHLISSLQEPAVWLGVLALGLIVALAAGVYPAIYLSSISPLTALTVVRRSWRTGFSLRQILVLVQLSVSIGVIASTMLMASQMRYVHDLPLGFSRENRLIVTLRTYDVLRNLRTIKNELRKTQGVTDVSAINQVPGTGHMVNLLNVESESGTIEPVGTDRIIAGVNLVPALNLQMFEGRSFSEDIPTDVQQSVIVNESFVRKLGWSKALGKRIEVETGTARVIGVVKDFHYASLHNVIGPLVIQPLNEQFDQVPEARKPVVSTSLIVVLSGDDLQGTVHRIRALISKFDPRSVFEPVFLDDRLNEIYQSETHLMKLIGTFAGICIFISIMGLVGLASFMAEQRTREIGIRQVLGASDLSIAALLSNHLVLLVPIAAIPASILSYRAYSMWMERFAYHTEVSPLSFIVATLLLAVVTLVTVGLQSLKAGRTNPIDALRYE